MELTNALVAFVRSFAGLVLVTAAVSKILAPEDAVVTTTGAMPIWLRPLASTQGVIVVAYTELAIGVALAFGAFGAAPPVGGAALYVALAFGAWLASRLEEPVRCSCFGGSGAGGASNEIDIAHATKNLGFAFVLAFAVVLQPRSSFLELGVIAPAGFAAAAVLSSPIEFRTVNT